MRRLPFLILTAVVLMAIPASVAPGFAQTATPTSTSTPGTPTATSTPGTPTATSTPGTPTLTTTPTTALPLALYVPIAVKGVAGDDSGIQVQNISGSAASVAIDYYDQAGNLIASDAPQTVAAGNSVTFYQPTEVGLPFGFDGSAVVRSNQNVAAIVNRVNYTGSLASAGSLTVPMAPTATQFTVPLVYGGMNGYITTLSVQNTSGATATYTVNLQSNVGSTGTASTSLTIPANAVRRVRVGTDVAVPAGFIGTAMVTGSATLVAVGETRNASTSVWLGYGGVATGTTTVNAPLLFKNYDANMWVSGAQVANMSNTTVTVNGSVKNRDDNTTYSLQSVTLGPNQGFFYDMLTVAGLPDNFVGSGIFTGSGPIAVTAQEISAPRQTGMGYNAFNAGTTRISIPLVFKNYQGWDTGVQVQNLGAVPTSVLINFFSPVGGLLSSETQVAQPGDSVTFYQPSNATLPSALVGSATVSSDGQPIVAITNEVNYLRGGDAAMAYEGINY